MTPWTILGWILVMFGGLMLGIFVAAIVSAVVITIVNTNKKKK